MRDWGLISSVFFGVLSVVLAFALYFYGRRYKRLTLTFHQTELQTKRHPDIAITFQGRQIDNLSRLRGVCWNSGKEAIRWEDIPPGLPPMLVFTNARVLSVVEVSGTAKTAFGIGQHSDQMAALHFGFLNPRDYGLFEVLYEAHPSARPDFDFQFEARVIGGSVERQPWNPPPRSWKRQAVLLSPVLLLLLLVLLFTVDVHGLGPVKRYALVAALGAVNYFLALRTVADTGLLQNARLPAEAKRFLAGRDNDPPR